MNKISLDNLQLNNNTKVNTIFINSIEVEVLEYLPIKEKMDLIEIIIQESSKDGYCNPVFVDVLLHTYIVLMYTNIELSDEEKGDILSTYDLLEKNNVIADVISAIPKIEYQSLVESTYECIGMVEKIDNSPLNIVREGINRTLTMIDEAKDAISTIDFNSENVRNVLAIAKDNGAI